MDTPELSTDADPGGARAASVPRVPAARAGVGALGADRPAARPVLSVATLRRTIPAGTYLLNYTTIITITLYCNLIVFLLNVISDLMCTSGSDRRCPVYIK